jgi:glycogenin glucosyltransferase
MEAWVTLATTDAYALGALVLGRSLRRVGTTRKLHCMVTSSVTQGMRLVYFYLCCVSFSF